MIAIRRHAAFLLAALCLVLPARAEVLGPGDYRFSLDVGGQVRSYLLHVPPQAAAGPLPAVISLHGGGGHARQHRRSTGMDAEADRDGYVAVYPNGSGRFGERLLTWNAGNCCGYAQEHQVDDVAFIAALIDDLKRRLALDARRVYVVGHSNGGMMAHRIGAALPDRVTAIVSVAGVHVPADGAGRRVMPVLHIHSVDDPRALYAGGLGPPFPFTTNRVRHDPVDVMLAAWVRRDGCDAVARETAYRESGGHRARLLIHGQCRDGAVVAHWQLTGAGHGWPGAKPALERVIGPATTVIDANTEIWQFVSRFSLPGPAAGGR